MTSAGQEIANAERAGRDAPMTADKQAAQAPPRGAKDGLAPGNPRHGEAAHTNGSSSATARGKDEETRAAIIAAIPRQATHGAGATARGARRTTTNARPVGTAVQTAE